MLTNADMKPMEALLQPVDVALDATWALQHAVPQITAMYEEEEEAINVISCWAPTSRPKLKDSATHEWCYYHCNFTEKAQTYSPAVSRGKTRTEATFTDEGN